MPLPLLPPPEGVRLLLVPPSDNLDNIEFLHMCMFFLVSSPKISKFLQICRNFRRHRLFSLKSPEIPADLHLFGVGSLEASTLGLFGCENISLRLAIKPPFPSGIHRSLNPPMITPPSGGFCYEHHYTTRKQLFFVSHASRAQLAKVPNHASNGPYPPARLQREAITVIGPFGLAQR